ncbi:hypothetical protein V6Z11_D08G057900 [Gossypium hirsutum]
MMEMKILMMSTNTKKKSNLCHKGSNILDLLN